MYRYAILIALITAACTNLQAKCESTARQELETIDQRIAEVRANLDRGYAIDDRGPSVGVNLCAGNRSSNIGISLCTSPTIAGGEIPVPIDAEAEERRLRTLLSARNRAEQKLEADLAACQAG